MTRFKERVPEGTYIELVSSLFTSLVPSIIMTASFAGIGLLVANLTPDGPLLLFIIGGAIMTIARFALLIAYRERATGDALCLADARRFERHFAVPCLGFALMLGAYGARAFAIAAPQDHMLIVGLLFGYEAGVAAGLALRPWISIPSMIIGVAPTILVAWTYPDATHRAAGSLLAVFLASGIESMLVRYRLTARNVTMRQVHATLARFDPLTHLPNRLALRERFADSVAQGAAPEAIAVHCLDLDRFKPVNDRYGHPVGDALLRAVAERLQGVLRPRDFAARIGGDEFVVVQAGITHAGEAEMLARRMSRAIAQPYRIDGQEIVIGASIGYAVSAAGEADLDRLIAQADGALYEAKRRGRGGVADPTTGAADGRASA